MTLDGPKDVMELKKRFGTICQRSFFEVLPSVRWTVKHFQQKYVLTWQHSEPSSYFPVASEASESWKDHPNEIVWLGKNLQLEWDSHI